MEWTPGDISNLIDTGITGGLAIYSGVSGNPINYFPVANPAAGLPAVAAAPSAVTSGFFANPWIIGIAALAVVALLWERSA